MITAVRDASDTMPRSEFDALTRSLTPPSVSVRDSAGVSVQGSRRVRNEDGWGSINGCVFAVADGMGGRPLGDVAAAAAIHAILSVLSTEFIDWATPVAAANAAVVEASSDAERHAGAVIVAMRCAEGRTSILHAGDARAYRLRHGIVEPLTRDHSVAEALSDVGVRRLTSGLDRRQLAAVTSYLGDQSAWKYFSVCELTVRRDDRIVLCTDGVHRHLSQAHWQAAGEQTSAANAAAFLVAAAQNAGSGDDATALVIDLDVESRLREHPSHENGR